MSHPSSSAGAWNWCCFHKSWELWRCPAVPAAAAALHLPHSCLTVSVRVKACSVSFNLRDVRGGSLGIHPTGLTRSGPDCNHSSCFKNLPLVEIFKWSRILCWRTFGFVSCELPPTGLGHSRQVKRLDPSPRAQNPSKDAQHFIVMSFILYFLLPWFIGWTLCEERESHDYKRVTVFSQIHFYFRTQTQNCIRDSCQLQFFF